MANKTKTKPHFFTNAGNDVYTIFLYDKWIKYCVDNKLDGKSLTGYYLNENWQEIDNENDASYIATELFYDINKAGCIANLRDMDAEIKLDDYEDYEVRISYLADSDELKAALIHTPTGNTTVNTMYMHRASYTVNLIDYHENFTLDPDGDWEDDTRITRLVAELIEMSNNDENHSS